MVAGALRAVLAGSTVAPAFVARVLEADVARLVTPAVLVAAGRRLELRRVGVAAAAAVAEEAVRRPARKINAAGRDLK